MSRRDPQGLGYDPGILRVLLDAYRRYLPILEQMRRESNEVAELLAIAALVDEFHAKILSAQRRLDRVETQRHLGARRAVLDQVAA
ncbi:MAG: hypothetical protein ABIO61_09925 [Thermomonas sp.]